MVPSQLPHDEELQPLEQPDLVPQLPPEEQGQLLLLTQLHAEEVVRVVSLLPQQLPVSLETPSVAGSDSLLPQQSDASVGVGTNIFTANAPAKTNPPARSETISTRPTIRFVLKKAFIFSSPHIED